MTDVVSQTTHAPFDDLRRRLADARHLVVVNGRYKHYKGGEYIVLGVALLEADDAVAVRYVKYGASDVEFVRPLSAWLSSVEVDGVMVPRFQKI